MIHGFRINLCFEKLLKHGAQIVLDEDAPLISKPVTQMKDIAAKFGVIITMEPSGEVCAILEFRYQRDEGFAAYPLSHHG